MKHKLLLAMTVALVMGSAGVAQDVPHDTAKVAKDTGHTTTTAAKDTGHAADVEGGTEDWSRGHKECGEDRRRSQVDTAAAQFGRLKSVRRLTKHATAFRAYRVEES